MERVQPGLRRAMVPPLVAVERLPHNNNIDLIGHFDGHWQRRGGSDRQPVMIVRGATIECPAGEALSGARMNQCTFLAMSARGSIEAWQDAQNGSVRCRTVIGSAVREGEMILHEAEGYIFWSDGDVWVRVHAAAPIFPVPSYSQPANCVPHSAGVLLVMKHQVPITLGEAEQYGNCLLLLWNRASDRYWEHPWGQFNPTRHRDLIDTAREAVLQQTCGLVEVDRATLNVSPCYSYSPDADSASCCSIWAVQVPNLLTRCA